MLIDNISFTKKWNLCCGCGVCAGICPKKCISWERKNGMFLPVIDLSRCVNCRLCAEVCPGLGHEYQQKNGVEAVLGNVCACYNAWSKNPEIRHKSASGGVVTSLVTALMQSGEYDTAFMLDTYDYHHQLRTVPFSKESFSDPDKTSFFKSRYLPVSHENAVIYIKENSDKKIIIIGSSCAIRGIQNTVKLLKKQKENYLFIGLFCDRVFNYNILDYYQKYNAGQKTISDIHFKNKESGGWPGNMKVFFTDGSEEYWDKKERTGLKNFFMPERCLYCIDKLNVCADISVGDNYTGQNSSELGSNSVIIRTEKGQSVWQKAASELMMEEVAAEKILSAQYIDWRLNNECYAKLKEKQLAKKSKEKIVFNRNVSIERNVKDYREGWQNNLNMLHAGEVFPEDPGVLDRQKERIRKNRNRSKTGKLIRRSVRYIKRKII